MGVRVALGAQGSDVIGMIVREGLRVVIPGVPLGAVTAAVPIRWIAPLLFQVSPKDPPVLVSVIVTLIAVAALASWLPAVRASRVDPNEALRAACCPDFIPSIYPTPLRISPPPPHPARPREHRPRGQ